MLSTVFLALVAAAPALKDKPKPQPTLVGEWVVETAIVGGNPSPIGKDANHWHFEADGSRRIDDAGGKKLAAGTYTADTKASPAALDLDPGAADVYPCIFRIDGDTLTLNVGWQKAPRPAAFESAPGSMCTLYTMKRVKKEDRP